MIKVILAEDNEILRKFVLHVLTSFNDVEVVGSAENGRDALNLLQTGSPANIVITDLDMPIMNGLELTRKIQETGNSAHVIILTSSISEMYLDRALQAGARGYISKTDMMDLHKHLQTVYQGGIAISRAMQCFN